MTEKTAPVVERQVTAYNNTYGKGINPEAVPQMVEALKKYVELQKWIDVLEKDHENDPLSDPYPEERYYEEIKFSQIVEEALKKAELK